MTAGSSPEAECALWSQVTGTEQDASQSPGLQFIVAFSQPGRFLVAV